MDYHNTITWPFKEQHVASLACHYQVTITSLARHFQFPKNNSIFLVNNKVAYLAVILPTPFFFSKKVGKDESELHSIDKVDD